MVMSLTDDNSNESCFTCVNLSHILSVTAGLTSFSLNINDQHQLDGSAIQLVYRIILVLTACLLKGF